MTKVVKVDGQLAIVLPQSVVEKLGLKEGYFVDIFELKPGIMAVTTKREVAKLLLGERKEAREQKPTPIMPAAKEIVFTVDELDAIQKLLSFRYEQRIPSAVDKQLSSGERRALSGLIQKGVVRIYRGGKYRETGVYDIPRRFYETVMQQLARGKPAEMRKEKTEKEEGKVAIEKEEKELTPLERLEKEGYAVVEGEAEARRLSEELRPRRRDIRGFRGFDRKYYVVKNSFIMKHAKRIRESLGEGNKTADQVAAATGLPKGACIAILTIMNEEGEVIEKRKGVFVLAE